MAKTIPAQEFKAAVKSLNSVLKENEQPIIKVVGVKKEEIQTKFTENVLDFIDNDRADELPDDVIDFYNNYIATDEEEEEEEPAPKSKAAPKKGKGKAAAKDKAKPKKEPKPKTDGVVALAVKAYMKENITTTKDITAHLESKFPGKNIKSTVSNVVCVLNHVEK